MNRTRSDELSEGRRPGRVGGVASEERFPLGDVIPRRGTGSVKWEYAEGAVGHASSLDRVDDAEVIPMWVADMDFACPRVVVEAIRQRANHPIFGYTVETRRFARALSRWIEARHGFRPDPQWMTPTEGVVCDLQLLVSALLRPGDGVIVHRPVYYPFFGAIRNGGGRIVACPLLEPDGRDDERAGSRPSELSEGRWRLDLARFESLAGDPRNRMTFLCNPHNPVGRVWSREELLRFAEIAARHRLFVVSDEIHGDLMLDGRRFIPYLSVDAADRSRTVVCSAPSKTFNLAGLKTSCLIAPNPKLRRAFQRARDRTGAYGVNPLGVAAAEAGWRFGAPWLDRVLAYLSGNSAFVAAFFAQRPELGVEVTPLEGTYLAWLDFRNSRIPAADLDRFLLCEARVRLKDGALFGPEGRGFVRMNLACPRKLLRTALGRIELGLRGPRGGERATPPGSGAKSGL